MYYAMRIRNAVNKGKEAWKIIKEMENTNPKEKDRLHRLDLDEEHFILGKHAIAQEINIFFTKRGEQKIGNPKKKPWSVMQEKIIISLISAIPPL